MSDKTPEKLFSKLPKRAKEIVSDVYYDSDGYWANLKDGFNWAGCSACHERTWKQLLVDLRHVVPCDSY